MAKKAGLSAKGVYYGLLIGAVLIGGWMNFLQLVRIRTLSFEADSLRAHNDTTKYLLGKQIKGLSDALVVSQRLVVQTKQQRDAVDRELRIERRARAAITATVGKVDTVLVAPVVDDDSVRAARFQHDETPFHVTADVRLPRAPADGTMYLTLLMDPIRAGFRFGCLPPVNGVRPATVAITGPEWLKFSVDTASQSPEVCNTRASVPLSAKAKYAALGAAALATLKALLDFLKAEK